MRVWIDTDIGDNPDDAVALLTAAALPDVDIAGVSVVGPEPERRVEMVRSLLGPDVAVNVNIPSPGSPAKWDAVIALGPLTNVAAAAPEVPITIMGGALRPVFHRGAPRRIETNFGADPAAAKAVLRAGFCRLVPLDVTSACVLEADEAAALAAAHPALEAALAGWEDPLVLHDPLAVLVAAGAVDYEDELLRVTVDAKGKVVAGRGIEQRVVVSADLESAAELVLDVLGG